MQGYFAYFCSILQSYSEELWVQQKQFLITIKGDPAGLTNEVYINKLQEILGQISAVKDTFHQIQKTVSWKLLVDLIAICLSLLCKMAWISVFILKPGVAVFSVWSPLSLVRHVIYIATLLVVGGLILIPPVLLQGLVR